MRTTSFAKVAALCGLLALSGCALKSPSQINILVFKQLL